LKTANSKPNQKATPRPEWEVVCVCVFLVLAVLAVFGQTARFEFVNYDDGENVYENPMVEMGLSVKAVGWAFTHAQVANWVPLTTLSHELDCQLFGLHAGGHHLVNVLLHAANAVLLFLVLRQMTGSMWRSAFVAAVFAVHPLRAESVAWVTERKDVLSALFFILSIGAYVRYVETWKASSFACKAKADRTADRMADKRGKVFYGLALVFFSLGLLAKSMVATLPFVLLLLDYWPLARMGGIKNLEFRTENGEIGTTDGHCATGAGGEKRSAGVPFWGLVREKVPFFALAAAAGAAAALVPDLVLTGTHQYPLLVRMDNALVSYVVYLRQTFFPAGLALPYPDVAGGPPKWEVGLALVLLAAISAGAMACRKRSPSVLVGWLWYLGMLAPVIGIVQISYDAAHADRYTYLPGIGLAIAVTWAVAEWSAGWKFRRVVLGGLMAGVIGAFTVCGHIQTWYWRESESLWTHTLASTSGNCVAHHNLGSALYQKGQVEEAIRQYQEALEIKPNYVSALDSLGLALAKNGQADEAIGQYRKALEINPAYEKAHNNLGHALAGKGDLEGAIAQFRQALEINPAYQDARYNLGIDLAKKGDLEEAITQYRKLLEINPDYAEARNNLGAALFAKAQVEEAITQFRKALETNPDYAEARNNLGVALFAKGDVEGAVAQYRKALEINPAYQDARNNLGRGLLRKGDFDGAMACFQRTSTLSPDPLERWRQLGGDFLHRADLEEAIECYGQALKINPRSADARANLGVALFQKGQTKEAMDSWQQALEIKPDQLYVLNNLAWVMATTPDAALRNGAKAVALAAQANQLSGGGDATVLRTLAAAYAEEGSYGMAAVTARRALALALAQEQKNDGLGAKLEKDIKLYEADKPAREGKQ